MATSTPTLFDVEGARRAGYSDGEILQHLAPSVKFDITGALKAGYQPTEVLGHLQTNAAIQSVPRPAPPSELAPDDFMRRVAERVKSNISLPFRTAQMAMDAQHGNEHGTAEYDFGLTSPAGKAAGKRDLQEEAAATHHLTGRDTFGSSPLGTMAGAATIGPRMIYDQVRGWIHDPASLVGDIGTAALAHAASGGTLPANKQFGTRPLPPPPELALAPEQQATYTAALDKANEAAMAAREAASQKFTKQAETYHGKLSEDFDTAKREQIATEAGQQQQAEANKQARIEWQQKVDAARESREQAAALDARKQQIAQAQQAMAEDTRQRAQSVYQAGRQGLDKRWDAVRDQVGAETPTPVQGVVNALNKAESEYLRGSPGSVTKFRQLAKELGVEDITGVPDEAEASTTPAGKWYQMNPDFPTAPWQTIRTHASAISRAMASGDLGNLYPAMKLVRNALEDVAGKIAEKQGAGDAYQAVRADEAQFRKDFEDLGPVSLGKGNPAARLVRAPNAAYASDVIHGKGSDLLEQALNRWDKSGELPTNIQQMRALREELQSLPKSVKVPPEPAPFVEKSITGAGVPEKKPPTAPELEPVTLKPVERPIPQPPPPGFITRHLPRIGRTVGKLTGGATGGWHGWVVGGELGDIGGQKLAKQINARPTLPPIPRTSEEYTRTMLAAKEGAISPGEMERRLKRGGAKMKVQPLPSPPQ